MLEEILDERVVSHRGRRNPRGVKRKMSGYPLRRGESDLALIQDIREHSRILTRRLARRASAIAPLTAGMAVVTTRGRPEGKWAGTTALNVGAAIFGVKARQVGRIMASVEEPNFAVTLEYGDSENRGRPLHVVVQGMPVATDRLWARLYGNDMVDRSHAFIEDPEDDWLNTFLPAALAMERMFASRSAPQSYEYLLAKTRLYVAACKSSLDPEGRQLEVSRLDAGWEAENPHPGLIPDGYFS